MAIARTIIYPAGNFPNNLALADMRAKIPASLAWQFTGYYEVDAPTPDGHITQSNGVGHITSIQDQRDGYGISATTTGAGNEPVYLATGGPGGRPAAHIADTSRYFTLPNDSKPGAASFSFVYVGKYGAGANDMIGTAAGDTGRHQLRFVTTILSMNFGTNGTEAIASFAGATNTNGIIIGSVDYGTKTAYLMQRVPGYTFVASATNASAVMGTGTVYVGRVTDPGGMTGSFFGTMNAPILAAGYERQLFQISDHFDKRFQLNL